MAISASKALAVGPDRRHLDPPAQHRALAGLQVAVDAVCGARRSIGGGKSTSDGRVPSTFSRGWPNVCSAARLNSVITPSWLIVMIGSSDDSRIAFLRACASVEALAKAVQRLGVAMDDRQAGGPLALRRLHAEHDRLHAVTARRLEIRRRLRPSQCPVLLTPGTARCRAALAKTRRDRNRAATEINGETSSKPTQRRAVAFM